MALAGCGEPQARQRGQRGHVRETRYRTCTWPLRMGRGHGHGYEHLAEPIPPGHVSAFMFVRLCLAFFLLVFFHLQFWSRLARDTRPRADRDRARRATSPCPTGRRPCARATPTVAGRRRHPAFPTLLSEHVSQHFLFVRVFYAYDVRNPPQHKKVTTGRGCRTTLPHSPGNAAPLRRALAGSTPKPSALSAAPRRRAAVAPPRVAP